MSEYISIESLLQDLLLSVCDGVLKERRAIIKPIHHPQCNSHEENLDYCTKIINTWRKDPSRPFIVDILFHDCQSNSLLLLERWKISYQKNAESNDANKNVHFVKRRISTLVRTLHCYIRLLPGYFLLKQAVALPTLYFQIYDSYKYENSYGFRHANEKFRFKPVSTSKGLIGMSVSYINTPSVEV